MERTDISRTRRVARRTAGGVLACGLILAAATAIAEAHGGDSSRVHACVARGSGTVRIVNADAECRSTEEPLDWNIQGATGLQGVEGPAGPQGEPGSLSGIHSVFKLSPFDTLDKSVEVRCPTGEVATGGGYNVAPDANLPRPAVVVTESLPVAEAGVPVGWRVSAVKLAPSTTPWTLVTDAICVPA